MRFIDVPKNKRLVWYLALEEYAAKHLARPDEGVFFTWVVDPTVIIGRHQVMAQEVNLPFCEANDINVFRRKSGGGCVYADRGNLMMSYIVKSEHPEQVFQQYLCDVANVLQGLGLPAVRTEHNDILVEGYKVSGNACYAAESVIVHGTLLYDVDFNMLQQAITPSVEKMAKHGVQSVRQRVMNMQASLGERIPTIEALSDCVVKSLCSGNKSLTDSDIAAVDRIEAEYLVPEFLYRL